ncbi:M23 family metallopeptidase [Kitasatospora sp. NPDC058965]|uniref:M23 family metallopeptidase n=1 Tax=Kitasatospora sp. NPDC058965 TaxID=3346682 RepID=UPI0036BC2F4F
MASTHTPALLDHPGTTDENSRHRLPRQSRPGSPVLGVTAMAAALGATTGIGATAAQAAAPAPAMVATEESGPQGADPGLALAARIQQQADQRTAAEEAARLEAAHEAAAKRAAQQPQPAPPVRSTPAVQPLQAVQVVQPVQAVAPQSTDAPLDLQAPLAAWTLAAAASPWAQLQTGLDLAAPAGAPVLAVAGGTVSSAGWTGVHGYRVIQTLPDGTEIWYCQLASITVPAGPVAAGAELGRVGTTGSATRPHLHLEVRPGGGAPVDPAQWLAAGGVTL